MFVGDVRWDIGECEIWREWLIRIFRLSLYERDGTDATGNIGAVANYGV